MFVDPGHFRRGVGGALHDALVRSWQSAGVTSARLWVWEFNTGARALYAGRGWRADGHERPDAPRIGEHRMLGYLLTVPAQGERLPHQPGSPPTSRWTASTGRTPPR